MEICMSRLVFFLQDDGGALNRRPSVTVQHILLYAADFIGNLRFT